MRPPDLWGWAPVEWPALDRRWLAAAPHSIPRGSIQATDILGIDTEINERIRYQADTGDAWALPAETLARGFGDCEDFALLKRAALIRAGVSPSDIWMLIVLDLLANCDHALLLVHVPSGYLILDSRWHQISGKPIPAMAMGEVRDYTPRFAFQASQQWTFGRRRPAA